MSDFCMASMGRTAAVGTLVVGLMGGIARAELLAYDGFLAGGSDADPANGEYTTGVGFISSGADAPGDALYNGHTHSDTGQAPATLGFIGAWGGNGTATSQFAASVYPRASATGLEYTDAQGQQLLTQAGSVDFFRATSSSRKLVRRSLDNIQASGDNDAGYASILIQFDPGQESRWGLVASTGQSRFGFDAQGRAFAESNAVARTTGTTVFETGVAHLMIVEFLDEADDGDDMINLYINPADLSDPLAGTPELANISLGEVYQSIPTHNLIQFLLWPNLDGSAAGAGDEGNVIYDEFRLGSSATSVTPMVPEPAMATLVGLTGLAMLLRRRRA